MVRLLLGLYACGPHNGCVVPGRHFLQLFAMLLGLTAGMVAADPALVLQPGTYLRLDDSGQVRVLDARSSTPFVQLDAGACRLVCSQSCHQSRVSIAVGEVLVTVTEAGEYHFNRELDRILVAKGRAVVRAGSHRVDLNGGDVLLLGQEIRIGKVGPVRASF